MFAAYCPSLETVNFLPSCAFVLGDGKIVEAIEPEKPEFNFQRKAREESFVARFPHAAWKDWSLF